MNAPVAKKTVSAVGLLVIMVAGLYFYSTFINPWSELWCIHQDINIKSGKSQSTLMLFYFPVHKQVSDTVISRTIKDIPSDETSDGPWHRVNTFALWGRYRHISPHYRFHSAINQIWTLNFLFNECKFSDAKKREIAVKVLNLWQQTGSDYRAGQYIISLYPE